MANLQHQNYFDLSGGQQNRTTRYLKAHNEWDFIKNGLLNTVGGVTGRNGYSKLGSAISSHPINQIAMFNPTDSEYLVAHSDSKMFRYDGSSWNSGTALFSGGVKVNMETFLDTLFAVDVVFPTVSSTDGVNFSTTTNVTDAPYARFVKAFGVRLYLAYTQVSGTTYPSRVYFSSLPATGAITWDTNESTGQYFDVKTDDNDYINGMEVLGNRLIIFKRDSIHRFAVDSSGNQALIQVPGAVGTTSYKSIIKDRMNGCLYYFHPNAGIVRYDGMRAEPISLSIQEFVEGVSDSSSVVAWSDGFIFYWFVGDVTHPTDSERNLTNGIFIYDSLAKRWTVGELSDSITSATMWFYDGITHAYLGSGSGQVYKWDTDTYTDDDAPIELMARKTPIYEIDPSITKSYDRSLIYSDPQNALYVKYRLIRKDGEGDWRNSIALNRPIEVIEVNPASEEARGIQYEFNALYRTKAPTIEGISNYYYVIGQDNTTDV